MTPEERDAKHMELSQRFCRLKAMSFGHYGELYNDVSFYEAEMKRVSEEIRLLLAMPTSA
jgi:hypothetical protein